MKILRESLKKSRRQTVEKGRNQVRWDKRDDPGYRALGIFLVNVAMEMLWLVRMV